MECIGFRSPRVNRTTATPKNEINRMEYQEFRAFMAYPAIDLLRGDNAAMVLGFLFRAFKAQHRAIVPEGQLRAILETYLEELRDAEVVVFRESRQFLSNIINSKN